VRGWNAIFACIVAALLASASGAHAANCPQAEISNAASALQDARNALMELSAGAAAETAPQAGTAIVEMKARLAAFVTAYMRCQPENADVDGIEVDLSRLGWASNDDETLSSTQPGRRLTFKAQYFGQGQIGVTVTFSVPSGVDMVSMTFRHADDGWAETGRHSGAPPR